MSPKCWCCRFSLSREKENAHFFILHGVHGNVFECECERNRVIRISWLTKQCNVRCFRRYNPILLAQPCELIKDRVYLFRKDTLQVHKKVFTGSKTDLLLLYPPFFNLYNFCTVYLCVNVQSFHYENINISLVYI